MALNSLTGDRDEESNFTLRGGSVHTLLVYPFSFVYEHKLFLYNFLGLVIVCLT